MSEPGFERNGILNYRSLTWQGRAVRAATYFATLSFMGFAVLFTEPDSTAWSVMGFLGVLSFFIGHAVVLWKMDWGYGRR